MRRNITGSERQIRPIWARDGREAAFKRQFSGPRTRFAAPPQVETLCLPSENARVSAGRFLLAAAG